MGFFHPLSNKLPAFRSILLAISSALLLILAFPDFEFGFLAFFALVPLFFAISHERESVVSGFIVGWVFGNVFFFGTCWWLTVAPIKYAGIPAIITYFLLFCATSFVAIYIGLFAAVLSLFIRRFGIIAITAAPFVWTATEFLRLWTTGNDWNAIGYSQAFSGFAKLGAVGGVLGAGFLVAFLNVVLFWCLRLFFGSYLLRRSETVSERVVKAGSGGTWLVLFFIATVFLVISLFQHATSDFKRYSNSSPNQIIAIQPNVPMEGLTRTKWLELREKQVGLAEAAIRASKSSSTINQDLETSERDKKTVILPESPMNFQYQYDEEFREFIGDFARRNNISVLFNSAEPDFRKKMGFFNSAVMINESGEKVAQYDKIYLLPFGEFVPLPDFLGQFVPTMVGRFSGGEEYDLLRIGDAKAGVMICFESHFPSLAREYVRNGADVLIEMTNDGYLGNTPVLRQHLANAVFRAVETNRPVIRVTNVGVTAYIDESGVIHDEAGVYEETTRIWSVRKSDGSQTLYVKYGDWFAMLCSIIGLGLLFWCVSGSGKPRRFDKANLSNIDSNGN